MVNGVLSAEIRGHTGSISSFTVTFNAATTDVAAQGLLNGVKTFLTSGGATIDNSSGTFTPTATSLT